MRQFRTIRVRFALWVAVWLLIILAAFGGYVYHRLSRDLAESVDDSLQLSASQAIAMVNIEEGRLNFSDTVPNTPTLASLIKRDLAFRLLNPSGQVLRALGAYPKLPVTTKSLQRAQSHQTDFATLAKVDNAGLVRVYTTPIVTNGQLIGIVQVAQSMEDTDKTLRRLLQALLAGGAAMVLVGTIGGYFLVARALAPIDYITRTAQRISAEDLSARLELPTTADEVGRLATTLDAMLARLDASFRRERQFTADASHELRTPLAAMQAILSVIRAERRTPEDYEQALSDLAEETERLRSLVEDLMQLARGDTRIKSTREQLDLATLLADVSDSMRPLAEAKGLALLCHVPAKLMMEGDSDNLIRLFVNLLDNAVKYTEHGSIIVSATPGAHPGVDPIQVVVSDTGIGIAAEHLPHIFDRFYRVDTARTSQGAGLGLAIALEIVRADGGTIEVNSTVGKGTNFTIQFPS